MTSPSPAPAASTVRRLRAACADLVRPSWADAAVALLLAYVSVWNAPHSNGRVEAVFGHGTTGLFVVLVIACTCAALLHRTFPAASIVTIGIVCLLHLVVFDSLSLLLTGAGLIAMETATSRLRRPWSWVAVGVGGVGAAIAVALVSREASGGTMEPTRVFVLVSVVAAFVAAAALTGVVRRRGRERREETAERLRIMSAQQEAERHLAVARERTRIARDVHDLLGHSLSVIGMQAEGARAVLSADPQMAEEALEVIARTSRSAIDEVRRLVDVLRADGDEDSALAEAPAVPGASQTPASREEAPGIDEIPALASHLRASGVNVSVSATIGASVSREVGACAYRTVQESLTNAVRHAPGSRIDVILDVGPASLVVRVENSAPVTDASGAVRRPDNAAGRPGVGLVAMRERADAVGATVTTGPTDDGGWAVLLTRDESEGRR